MRQQDTLIRVAVRERAHLPFISNRGMQIYLNSYSWRRIMERKNREREICSMLSGSPTCLWREFETIRTGLYSVRMRLKVCSNATVKNSKNYTQSTSKKARAERLSRPKNFGRQSSIRKLKQALLTCFTRIMPMRSLTISIWAQSRVQIFVVRSLSTPLQMKSRYATWLRSLCRAIFQTEFSTTQSFMKWLSKSLVT